MLSIEEVHQQIKEIIQAELSKRLLNIVLFGYPGSGRGTQGKAIAKKYGLEYIATGPMLDEEIKKGTEIGKKVLNLYENGLLVPDEIVVPLIEKKLENSKGVRGYIFKGFPSTFVQSYILDGLLKKHGSSIATIIELEVPILELIQRLVKRSQTDECMPYDSSIEKIVQRLKDHENKTIPVIKKYQELHGVVKIDGMGTFEEVFERISFEIENGFKNLR